MEELEALVGQEVGVSDWIQIDQDRIDRFAKATDDHQWIHVDQEAAAAGPFGGTIAHGYLTLALIPHLNAGIDWPIDSRMGINYGVDRVRFISPVPVGSRVRARTKVLEVKEIPSGAHLKNQVTIEIEGSEKPACVAETLTRFYI